MTTPPLADRWLRALLGLPGAVLERLDGGRAAASPAPVDAALADAVLAAARHPEAHLALEDGLHHHRAGELVLAWQRRGATAFGVGGLNAPAEARVGLLRSWVAATRARGLRRHLLFPLRREELGDAARAGLAAVQVGVEAVLDLPALDFSGNRFGTVRQMSSRARRRGVTVDWWHPHAATPAARAELEDTWACWLASRRPAWRMRLLVGTPALSTPWARRYLVARGPQGRVEGFLTVVPGAPGAWGVDVMCRRPDAVGGTMELLIRRAVADLRAEGAATLSLGPVPMAGVDDPRTPWLLRTAFDTLYRSRWGNQLFGFRALHAFKRKFRPRWEPVYFAAAPTLGVVALYRGCRMWGLL